jgi:xanthine dehydrogenase accessory factor
MDNIDLLVLRTLRDWRREGHHAILATVVRTWGSSPRPLGSMMALREDGRTVGSVSGGCVEDDLIRTYSAVGGAAVGRPGWPAHLVRYGVTADEAHRFGLPCGGTLELLLEADPEQRHLEAIVSHLDAGQLVRRAVNVESGEARIEAAEVPGEMRFSGTEMSHVLGPGYRMLLIGAGALAEYLATMALFNGFMVTVCDPRPENAGNWSVPGVSHTREMPDDAVLTFRPDSRSAIVALSHDPKLDDLALLEALHSPAFYVGAIGSRRNSETRRARLIEYFNETEESLRRLRGPVGIYIGSKTPAEIAVSIMAEILAVKNGITLPASMDVASAKTAQAGAPVCA